MKTATVDKNAVGGKFSRTPLNSFKKFEKGLRFSELKTLQDTLHLPFESSQRNFVFRDLRCSGAK